jgi:hypothetical protein
MHFGTTKKTIFVMTNTPLFSADAFFPISCSSRRQEALNLRFTIYAMRFHADETDFKTAPPLSRTHRQNHNS